MDAPDPDPSREIGFAYDLAGNLTETTDDQLDPDPGTPGVQPLYTFTYDALNRVDVATAHYLPGGDRQLDPGYDRFGNRETLSLTDPGGPQDLTHTWSFDALDRLAAACLPQDHPCTPGQETLAFRYRANDELEVLTHGNGTTTTYGYFAHGPLKSLLVESGAPAQLHRLVYSVDEIGSIVEVVEQLGSGDPLETYDYAYDGVDRLKQADYPAAFGLPADPFYHYDPAGNRDDADAMGDPLGTHVYDENNRIEAGPAGVAYVFDDDGNLLTRTEGPTTDTYAFDTTNRLRSVRVGGEATPSITYLYDPFGRRLRKTVSGVTEWYLWDGDRLLAEYDAGGSRRARYAYAGGFAPVEVAFPNGPGEDVYAVHTDHLDTPRMLTDANGAPAWRAVYAAFGEAHVTANPGIEFHTRFPGQYYDKETERWDPDFHGPGQGDYVPGSGLHYNRFRYYDPAIGRYISADPIGQRGGINLYTYARNNPVNWIDPFGLDVDIVITRTGTTPTSLDGRFTATSTVTGNSVSGYTLEDPNPTNPSLPVPPGSYSAHVDSRAARADRVELDNVPNASYVQIHAGNTAANVDGCFAVGTSAGNGRVNNSAPAMSALNNLIAADGTGNITVTVVGSGNSSQPPPNMSVAPPNMSYGP